MRNSLRRANQALALASIGAAAIAVVAPALMTRNSSTSNGDRYYALMYAARAIPLGIGVLTGLSSRRDDGVDTLLLVAAASQAADAGIGVWRREPGQVIGPSLAAVVHLLGARSA